MIWPVVIATGARLRGVAETPSDEFRSTDVMDLIAGRSPPAPLITHPTGRIDRTGSGVILFAGPQQAASNARPYQHGHCVAAHDDHTGLLIGFNLRQMQ
jgi:hypothetical protein